MAEAYLIELRYPHTASHLRIYSSAFLGNFFSHPDIGVLIVVSNLFLLDIFLRWVAMVSHIGEFGCTNHTLAIQATSIPDDLLVLG